MNESQMAAFFIISTKHWTVIDSAQPFANKMVITQRDVVFKWGWGNHSKYCGSCFCKKGSIKATGNMVNWLEVEL